MGTFTAVIPVRSILPPELSLLLAPIRAREPTEPEGYVGQSEGALLDQDDHVVAFIVRLAKRFAPTCPRTLVDASAVTVTDDSVLRLSWTEAQLLAQPRLDDALHVQEPLPGTDPIPLTSMAAHEGTPAVDDGTATKETIKEGAEGVALGAVVGAVAGFAAGGPIGLSLAAFFALGGGLVGVISGATQPTAAEVTARDLKTLTPPQDHASVEALQRLGERLQDPALQDGELVRLMRFSRASATVSVGDDSSAAASRSQAV